jgi:hypothetical protein
MKKVRIILGIGALAAPVAIALAPGAAQAATREATCGTAPNHWTEFKDGGSTTCFGYNGGTFVTGDGYFIASKECGGNNYGWYSFTNQYRVNFHEGTTFTGVKSSGWTDLHISDWSGTDTCG